MKKFQFYFNDCEEEVAQGEVLLCLDNLSDVIKETEELRVKYKGVLSPAFLGQFLETLYSKYRFTPINGVNFAFCIGVEVPREDLHVWLWKVIRKSNLLSLVVERKVIDIMENMKGSKVIVQVVLDKKDADMVRKWGTEISKEEAFKILDKKTEPIPEPEVCEVNQEEPEAEEEEIKPEIKPIERKFNSKKKH